MIKIIKNLHLKYQKYYICLILLLGFVLRLRGMLNRDFWYDEAFTGVTVKSNFWEMIRITINDVHPPLYYVALKLFASFFNYSVFGIRFFSVIFGVLGLWGIYLFTKELFNKEAAYFATLLAAISPFAIQYSQEGRMYSMLSFFIIMGAYFLLRGLKTKKYKYFFIWGILMGLSFLTHYMGVIFSALYYAVYVFYNFTSGNSRSLNWKNKLLNLLPDKKIIAGYTTSLILFSFWIKTFIGHLLYSGLNNMHWVRPASFSDILTTAQIFIFGSPLGDLSAGMPSPISIRNISSSSVLIGVALLFGFIIPYLVKKEKEKTIFTLVYSFGFMLIIYLMSLWGESYFVSRYLISASYFLFSLLGVWLASVNWKLASSAFIVYLFILGNVAAINYQKGYGQLAQNLGKYNSNNFYVLNSFDYVIAKYYVGADHLILYNIDWPQYNPSYWAAIGPTLKRTESYDTLKNDANAIILANIQKPIDRRNDKSFDPVGLPLIAKYDNITLYKPSN